MPGHAADRATVTVIMPVRNEGDFLGRSLGAVLEQEYPAENVRLEPGDTAVLFTDGLLEARRDGELYGEERLDAALLASASLPAQELAEAVVEDCRAFAGELADDCAVVVVKRA